MKKQSAVTDSVAKLRGRVRELEAAIRKHRGATGHDLCWENDEALWAVLRDGKKLDHTPPPWEEFMQRCAAYRASREHRRPRRK